MFSLHEYNKFCVLLYEVEIVCQFFFSIFEKHERNYLNSINH